MDSQQLAEALGSGVSLVLEIVICVLLVVAMWKIFTKAGEAGWKSLIPFYNTYIFFKIIWGNGWLFLLLLIPFVNIVIAIIAEWKLCKAFGYGVGMFILSLFFPNIAQLIIAFGSSEYLGPQ